MNVSKLIKVLQKIQKENGPRTPVLIDVDSAAGVSGGDYNFWPVVTIEVDSIPYDAKGEGNFNREKTVAILDVQGIVK